MSLEVNLRSHLIQEITEVEGRIYPQKLPQDPDFPAITYNLISTNRSYSHSGDTNTPVKLIQIDCWADRYGPAKQVAAKVVAKLSGYLGLVSETEVGQLHLSNEMDDYNEDTGWYKIPLDFNFGYYE